jgi:hypothetical protein
MTITLERKDNLEIRSNQHYVEIKHIDLRGDIESVWIDAQRLPIVIDALERCLAEMLASASDDFFTLAAAPKTAPNQIGKYLPNLSE